MTPKKSILGFKIERIAGFAVWTGYSDFLLCGRRKQFPAGETILFISLLFRRYSKDPEAALAPDKSLRRLIIEIVAGLTVWTGGFILFAGGRREAVSCREIQMRDPAECRTAGGALKILSLVERWISG